MLEKACGKPGGWGREVGLTREGRSGGLEREGEREARRGELEGIFFLRIEVEG